MTAALPTDIIIQHCDDRKWQYRGPIEDLDAWVAKHWDAFDPQFNHRLYWPDRQYKPDMDILVVDGGTTQAPVIARMNPQARITATVHSKESHDHAIYLRHKHRLLNLDLCPVPIDEVSNLGRSFDLVIASGVFQDAGFAEAQIAMKSLAEVLRPDGVAAFLLFSRYVADSLDANSPLHTGISFGVQDCLDLVDSAGLVFQDWLVKSPYYPPTLGDARSEVTDSVSKLPKRQMWQAMDSLRNQNGCHLLTACRPEREARTYRIDFDDPRALEYIPGWRLDARLDGRHAVRPDWSMSLAAEFLEMAEKIDGFRTIRQIAGADDLNPVATALMKELWRMDFILFGLPPIAVGFDQAGLRQENGLDVTPRFA